MRNKIIAITGHKGVLGKSFIQKYKNNKFLKCNFDIRNRSKIFKWIKNNNFDVLLHFAAIVPTIDVDKNEIKSINVNYNGTKNIVDALIKHKEHNKPWIFLSSTSHVYKFSKKILRENSPLGPISFYGKTKLLAEKYFKSKLEQKNFIYCIGRIFSFTHTSQKKTFFVPSIFEKLAKAKLQKISFKNMYQKRDFISVSDIARAISELYKQRKKGVYNICSNKGIDLHHIINLISKKIGSKIKIIYKKDKSYNNLVGSNLKLSKIGWKHKDSLNKIINEFYKKK